MTRSKQVPQTDLPEEEKCEGGVCKSNDTHWTHMCDKHKAESDRHSARWEYYRKTGIDLDVNEEVPKS